MYQQEIMNYCTKHKYVCLQCLFVLCMYKKFLKKWLTVEIIITVRMKMEFFQQILVSVSNTKFHGPEKSKQANTAFQYGGLYYTHSNNVERSNYHSWILNHLIF